jgi:hypothetical protein
MLPLCFRHVAARRGVEGDGSVPAPVADVAVALCSGTFRTRQDTAMKSDHAITHQEARCSRTTGLVCAMKSIGRHVVRANPDAGQAGIRGSSERTHACVRT